MKSIKRWIGAALFLLSAGCASFAPPQATVTDGVIENPAIGFFGFRFEIPDGYELYQPDVRPAEAYSPLQQMAIRIYDRYEEWHPRGDERFYESFLLLADRHAVLLVTMEINRFNLPEDSPFTDSASSALPVLPAYNPSGSRRVPMGGNNMEAVWTRGYAYEQDGWYYAGPNPSRMLFNYQICRADGSRDDRYILMSFALPEYEADLTAVMQRMMDAIRF